MKSPWATCSGLLLAALLFTGCASTRFDWDNRVGSMTYDQAVLEMGPPDNMAQLSDGTKVVEWLVGRSGGAGHMYVMGRSAYYHQATPPAVHYLRAVFDPDGLLRNWRTVLK